MKLVKLNPLKYKHARSTVPSIRFARGGQVTLSNSLSDILDLEEGDSVSISLDEDSKRDYYISKGVGFKVRRRLGKGAVFNAAKLSRELLDNFGEYGTSIRFRVAAEPVQFEGEKYYSIFTSHPL